MKRLLYINERAPQERRIKSLWGLLKEGKTSKQFKDELEQLIRQELEGQGMRIVDRNFYEVPKDKRPKGFNVKFATMYVKTK